MNTPKHRCVICKRYFYWKGEASRGEGKIKWIRRVGSLTCSKKCTRVRWNNNLTKEDYIELIRAYVGAFLLAYAISRGYFI